MRKGFALQLQVLLDGCDIRTLDLAWYRSHIGLVSQVWPGVMERQ